MPPPCRTPPGQKPGYPPGPAPIAPLMAMVSMPLWLDDTSTAVRGYSSSWSPPDTSRTPFPHRSPRRSSANAACGGLKPPPDRRLRRAKPSSPTEHRFLKVLPTYLPTYLPTSRPPFLVRGALAVALVRRRCGAHPTDPSRAPTLTNVTVPSRCLFGNASALLGLSRLGLSRLLRLVKRYCQNLWMGVFQATSVSCDSSGSAGVMSMGRSRSFPLRKTAPLRTRATRCGALTARQRVCAASISL